jgi:uncharacterized protein
VGRHPREELTVDHALWTRLHAEAQARAADADPAHDFSHVMRVVASARAIATEEKADVDVATTAALLHELFNHPKGHPESHLSGDICAEHARALLEGEGAERAFVAHVADAIRTHAFSRGLLPTSLEGKVLQDADRLDAIGAIGIARCFATCATMKRPFYAPDDPMCRTRAPNDKLWGTDHFFTKLLRIPAQLHTATGRAMAEGRAGAMRAFLEQFEREIGAES